MKHDEEKDDRGREEELNIYNLVKKIARSRVLVYSLIYEVSSKASKVNQCFE